MLRQTPDHSLPGGVGRREGARTGGVGGARGQVAWLRRTLSAVAAGGRGADDRRYLDRVSGTRQTTSGPSVGRAVALLARAHSPCVAGLSPPKGVPTRCFFIRFGCKSFYFYFLFYYRSLLEYPRARRSGETLPTDRGHT